MKAFHGYQAIKDKYVARIIAHQAADELVKGHYWENGKGCAVGCTIHGSNHGEYETELGIPWWLARLEDRIFEGLPNDRAMQWPREFLEAIRPGQDLEKIKIPMLIFIVDSARDNFNHQKYPAQLIAIDNVLSELRKKTIDKAALKVAADDADAAAAAADDAAAAAAAADDAAAAADDAAAAAAAADAAAAARRYYRSYFGRRWWHYYSYPNNPHRVKHYVKFADKTLELIRALEVG